MNSAFGLLAFVWMLVVEFGAYVVVCLIGCVSSFKHVLTYLLKLFLKRFGV